MNRRTFLLGTIGLAGAGLVSTLSPALAAPGGAVIRFVRLHCPAESLSDADLADFAADYLRRSGLAPAKRRAVLFLMDHPWATRLAPPAIRAAQERQERHLITRFLLSTDLFDAERASGPPRYWGAADPYALGCANPAARFGPADSHPLDTTEATIEAGGAR